MKKLIINFITLFIWNKKTRKIFRRIANKPFLQNFTCFYKCFLDFFNILKTKKNFDVCILELNPFHAECLFSVYKYLNQTNKKILILTTPENISLDLFKGQQVDILKTNPFFAYLLDKNRAFNSFNVLFVGSYFIWEYQLTIDSIFKNYLKHKKIGVIDHAPGFFAPIESKNKNIYKFVLAKFLTKTTGFPFLSLCYFPSNCVAHKKQNNFLSVGVLNDMNRRDSDALIEYAKNNLDCHFDFISSCNDATREAQITSLKNSQIHIKPSFDILFSKAQQASFIPFIIHEQQMDYYLQAISGNLNLCLGFNIIPILDYRLAEKYGLDDSMAIIYNGKVFFKEAMNKAKNMTEAEFSQKRNSLEKFKNQLLAESFKNIKELQTENIKNTGA